MLKLFFVLVFSFCGFLFGCKEDSSKKEFLEASAHDAAVESGTKKDSFVVKFDGEVFVKDVILIQ